MLPMVGVPETMWKGLRLYRDLLGRAEGFEHVSRYVSGLIVSSNKTVQGIYAQKCRKGRNRVGARCMKRSLKRAGRPRNYCPGLGR